MAAPVTATRGGEFKVEKLMLYKALPGRDAEKELRNRGY
jgi:hypothetical protein